MEFILISKIIHLKKSTIFITALCTAIAGTLTIQAMEQALFPQLDPKIQHVAIRDKKDLDNQGCMTSDFLSTLLSKIYKENKLLKALFTNGKTEIKKLSEELAGAPWGTTQLFLVKCPEISFIVKGMKDWKKEVSDLVQATTIPRLDHYFYPNKNNKYPQFLFPIAYVSYDDQKQNKHYVSVMPKAPGFSLANLIKIFAKQPGDRKTIQQTAQAYFDTGAAMSRFYLDIQGKITHGDLHHGNIFYKPETHQVTLIDNERIASSSKHANVYEDIAFLLMKSLFVVQWTTPDVIKKLRVNERLNEWYALYVPSFIAGYLSVLPQQDRNKAYKWLVDHITHYISGETGKVWYTDESVLEFNHKKYMEPIFNELCRSEILFHIDKQTVNAKDSNQKTLLHHAALNGEWLTIWPLISAGAQVNVRDNEQNTPLHEASYNNHRETIKALVRAGADLHAKNGKGETPLIKAKSNNSTDALDVLHHYGAQY
jgi:Ankyrin repeats (3 copies)